MRFLAAALILCTTACGTDQFIEGDGASDAPAHADVVGTDALSNEGGVVDASPPPNPKTLGSKIVLWIDAADAKTNNTDAGTTVSSWPDHINNSLAGSPYSFGTSSLCLPAVHVGMSPTLNKPTVTFCNAFMKFGDASSLQIGNSPFMVAAVIRVDPSASNAVLITKSLTSESIPLSGMTVLTPGNASRAVGSVDTTNPVTAATDFASTFQIIVFIREQSQIEMRLAGSTSTPIAIPSNDDVSMPNGLVEVGGYSSNGLFGEYPFNGELAELIWVKDSGLATLDIIEGYFKAKYGL